MSYKLRKCPNCGANLDAGERCDCQDIRVPEKREIRLSLEISYGVKKSRPLRREDGNVSKYANQNH